MSFGTPHDGLAMTFEEIAARLGISPSGAERIAHRAIKKLRKSAAARQILADISKHEHGEAVTDSTVNLNLRFAKSQRSK